ncbi:uncharacterized protein METZ01_LOCUS306033, partial [marine metagenome]
MAFENILGQDRPKETLHKALLRNRIPNSYLFYGPESTGKKFTAIEVCKALNCETLGPVDSCNKCLACQKIKKGVYPDLFMLKPKKKLPTSREAIIYRDDIRELLKTINFLPYEGSKKVVIIDNAEHMNPQAANAFMKTLE